MSTTCKLDMDKKDKKVDQKLYRGMIGSLLYLTASRPDIMYSTCICARFQSDPRESHLGAVKRILRYLKGTQNIGLWYDRNSTLTLNGYTDSDFQGDRDSRKSTSGSVFTLGGAAVVWRSVKQSNIADSTIEVEYIAASEAAKEAVWLKNFLSDMEVVPNIENPNTLYCDNNVLWQSLENRAATSEGSI